MGSALLAFAGTGPSAVEATTSDANWFLENVWIAPAIMATSFLVILFFGKRMPKGGSEVGIAAVGLSFVFALITGAAWLDHRDNFHGEYTSADQIVADYYERTGEEPKHADDHGDEDHSDEDHSDEDHDALSGDIAEEGLAFVDEEGDDEHSEGHPAVAIQRGFTWFQNGNVHFEVGILVDGATVLMLFVVTLISLLVHIYSTDYVAGDRRYTHFFAFLSLFTASMLLLIMSQSTIQLITAWELVGVCSFALIGHWWEEKPNSDAALKAFLTNRVGDVGLLVGMIILFFAAGNTFDIVEINTLANSGVIGHNTLLIASVCLMAAVMSKSGQFVLHTWLPDAMAGPTPVSALIHAATMVVAGVFMIARMYGVFFEGFSIAGSSVNLMAIIGAVTVVFGGLLAFVQNDIKKVLAYSTVSQLGYMVMALGVGAWTAALFHLFTHAFFKAGLFLGAGSVSHSVHSFDMKTDMGGMRKFMPTTYKTFVICSLALVGVFPLAGFWSKDEILVGTGGWGLFGGTNGNGSYTLMVIMGIAGAALTAAYMTRVIYLTFFGEFRGHGHPHESGKRITVPLIILSVFAVGAGFLNFPVGFQLVPEAWQERFGHFIEPEAAYFPSIAHGTPSWSLAIFASAVGIAGIAVAAYYYFVGVENASKARGESLTELPNGLTTKNKVAKAGHTALVEKYFLDRLYTDTIAAGTKGPIADGTYWFNQNVIDKVIDTAGETSVKAGQVIYEKFDQLVVDGAVNATGKVSSGSGEELRRMQTGKVQQYAAILFAAATVLAGIFIIIL